MKKTTSTWFRKEIMYITASIATRMLVFISLIHSIRNAKVIYLRISINIIKKYIIVIIIIILFYF